MKKFKVKIIQEGYRYGYYEISAPDLEAAEILAQDIKFNEPYISWDEFIPYMGEYPKFGNIFIEESD